MSRDREQVHQIRYNEQNTRYLRVYSSKRECVGKQTLQKLISLSKSSSSCSNTVPIFFHLISDQTNPNIIDIAISSGFSSPLPLLYQSFEHVPHLGSPKCKLSYIVEISSSPVAAAAALFSSDSLAHPGTQIHYPSHRQCSSKSLTACRGEEVELERVGKCGGRDGGINGPGCCGGWWG